MLLLLSFSYSLFFNVTSKNLQDVIGSHDI